MQAFKQLSQAPIKPVYLLTSTETLLLEDAREILFKRVVQRQADFNSEEIDLSQHDIRRLIAAACTLPMMAEKRWVYGRHLEKLSAKSHATLIGYLDNPTPSTVLVFTAAKIDRRTKLAQAFERVGAHIHLMPPRGGQIPQWLKQRGHTMGIEIGMDACMLLVELVGTDLALLLRSLEFLHLLAGPQQTITVDHVSEGIRSVRMHSVFELTDAISAKNWALASTLMRNLLHNGESSLVILSMLVRQLRLLLQAKQWRGHPQDLAHELGLRPFVAERLLQQSKNFSDAMLYRALKLANDADMRLKSSGLKSALVLDHLLAEMLVESDT